MPDASGMRGWGYFGPGDLVAIRSMPTPESGLSHELAPPARAARERAVEVTRSLSAGSRTNRQDTMPNATTIAATVGSFTARPTGRTRERSIALTRITTTEMPRLRPCPRKDLTLTNLPEATNRRRVSIATRMLHATAPPAIPKFLTRIQTSGTYRSNSRRWNFAGISGRPNPRIRTVGI